MRRKDERSRLSVPHPNLRAARAGGHTGHTGHTIGHSVAKGVCVRVPPAISRDEGDGVASFITMDDGLEVMVPSIPEGF